MCSKRLCCATVGQGWGRPCEECPARVGNCTKGRLPPLCTGELYYTLLSSAIYCIQPDIEYKIETVIDFVILFQTTSEL